jgi:nitroreductase
MPVNPVDLVAAAVLAPSSHNTQPWLFRIGGRGIELYADPKRALPANDPSDRELTISCGAALFNARVAAARLGAALSVERLPEGDASDLLARLVVSESAEASPEGVLFEAMAARRTYRKQFEDVAVGESLVGQLVETARDAGGWLEPLTGARRDEFAALVAQGDRSQFADDRWRRELASWIRFRRDGEGLAYFGRATRATRLVVRHLDVGANTAKRDAALAKRAPVVAVLGTGGDSRSDWLAAGELLQHVLLTAAAHGLQASFLNQPIQVAGLRPGVAELAARDGFAQVAIRLGHPRATLRRAPRRPVEAVLVPGG